MKEQLETGWLSTTPTHDTLLRSFLRNQAELNRILADAAGGSTAESEGIDVADAGSVVPYLNQAVLHRPLTGVDDAVLDVAERALPADRAGTLLSAWPSPDLSARGWHLMGHPAFVVRGPASATRDPHPSHPGVEVQVADSAEDLRAAELLLAQAYPVPEAVAEPPGFAFPEAVRDSPVLVRTATVDGEPSAVAASLPAHGVVNLCMAATLPVARHRGAWTALVEDRCGDRPDLPAAAFTSDDSRPGFVKLGFLPVLRFTLWLRPPA